MKKIIKRIAKVLMWFLITLIVLFGIVYILIQQPSVQTYVVHKVTDYLSDKLHTKVSIKSVNLSFFTSAVIEDINIEDRQGDTILYAQNLKARFGIFELLNQNFEVKDLSLENIHVRLFRGRDDSDFNYQFIIDAFTSSDTSTAKTKNPFLKLGIIHLKNIAFTYRDEPSVDVTVHLPEFTAEFNKLNLDEPLLDVKKIILERPLVEITTLYDSLPSENKTEPNDEIIHLNTKSFVLLANKFQMNNGHFIYTREHTARDTSLFDENHLDFSGINFEVENGKFLKDTITGFIKNLSAHEQSGLEIKKLTADVRVTPSESELSNLSLKLPHSEVKDNFIFQYTNFRSFYDFIASVYMRTDMKNSTITLSDLSCFSPELKKMMDPMSVTGKFSGTVDNLKFKELDLQAANQTVVRGKGNIQGLPNIQGTLFDLQMDEAISSGSDLKIIYPDIKLPEEISRAGLISMKGTVFGFLNDFTSQILVNTDEGMVQTDLNMKLNNGIPKYNGAVSSSNFNLGKIFALDSLIGKVSFSTTVSGNGFTLDELNTSLIAKVDKFEFLGYPYRNISVNGILDSKVFTGKLLVNDPNIQMDFQGKIDLQDSIPDYDFYAEVNDMRLDKLGFISRPLMVSSNLTINLKGKNPLTGTGTIVADKTILSDEDAIFKVKKLDFAVTEISLTEKHLSLITDFATVEIDGEFNLPELPDAMVDALKFYLPSMPADLGESPSLQNFDFALHLNKMVEFNNFFLRGIEGLSNTALVGHFANARSEINFSGNIPYFKYGKTFSNDVVLYGESNEGTLNLSATSNFLQLNDSIKILDPFVSCALANNSGLFNIKANDQSGNYKIDLTARATGEAKNIHLKFLPSSLILNQQLWLFNPANEIIYSKNSLRFSNTSLNHDDQVLTIQNVTLDDSSSMKLSFNKVHVEDFYNLFRLSSYEVKGKATGYASIMNLFDKQRYDANLTITQFGFNGDSADKVIAIINYDPVKDQMNIDGKIKDDLYDVEAKGTYKPGKKTDSLNFKIEIVKSELPILNKYLGDYIEEYRGKIAGQLFLKGTTDQPNLTGTLTIPSDSTKINYLNTAYHFDGANIDLTENKISIRPITLYDDAGNTGILSGFINHNYLSDFYLDVHLSTKNLHMLHTTQFDNSIFYGEAYAGGTFDVLGAVDDLQMNATLVSNRGTEVSIPVSDEASVSGNSFVRFVKHDSTTVLIQKISSESSPNLHINFDLTLNPLAKVNIIFDQKAGDIISGTGNGNIRMEIDLGGDFSMFGNYVIEKGDYNFTLQNFFNKKFAIDKGSTISWNGDPYQAQIDINAIYSLSRVSFADLVAGNLDQLADAERREIEKKVPVDVYMHLTGSLLTPNIDFDIRQPKNESGGNSFASRKLGEIRADENELNKQVFGLLMINRFLPPEANTGGLVSSGVNTSVSEFLANQLSYWASQNKWNIGFNINTNKYSGLPGSSSTDVNASRREMQLVLTKSIFHERVTMDIGGNLDYNTASAATKQSNAYLSDFTLEYKITPDGRFVAKAYSRSQYDVIEERNRDTYGVALSFKKDFNKLGELFRSDREKKKYKLKNQK